MKLDLSQLDEAEEMLRHLEQLTDLERTYAVLGMAFKAMNVLADRVEALEREVFRRQRKR